MKFQILLKQFLFLVLLLAMVIPSKANTGTKYILQQSSTRTIKGKVLDNSDNSPLIGVGIMVKGTTKGTITDIDGNFSLDINDEDKTLVFSYIGMKPLEINISDQKELLVKMTSDAFGLEEVVISGVASATPKKNLTISVERVDASSMKAVHASSAANALQGKVAGLNVIVANGLPGSGATLRLRGATSLNSKNKPLIILDGNRIHTNMADINLDDIESFEVVKGAAASALYGSEAGNGVIVMISKRGKKNKEGKTQVIVRSEYGSQQISKFLPVATHQPYKLVEDWKDYDFTKYDGVFYYNGKKISGNRIVTENGYADQPFAKNYNHQESFFKKGQYHTEYIGITGNNEKSNFLLSFENNRQEGIIKFTDGYQRNNLKFNMDQHISDKTTISISNLLMKAESNNPGSYGTFQDLLFLSPDVDLFAKNPDSTDYLLTPDPWKIGLVENPLYPLANRDKKAKRISIVGNVKLKYYITDWLKAEAKYAYEYRNKNWTTITPKGYLQFLKNKIQKTDGALYKRNLNELSQDMQFTLHFNKVIKDFTNKVKLSYLYENSKYESVPIFSKGFTIKDIPNFNNVDPLQASLFSEQTKIVTIDYFGIYDLSYKDKYLFSALYRIDGSSLFGSEARWNPYYRISLGYRVTEDFKLPGIEELKLRAALGTSGLRPGFSYQYEVLRVTNGNVPVPYTEGNKFLKPSNTREFEFGLNINFLKRFSLEVTYANSLTKDAFQLAPQASHIGAPYKWTNVGTLSSKSLEANLEAQIIDTKDFGWTANVSFDRIRQKVEDLTIPAYFTGPKKAFYIAPGESFGVIYGTDWVRSLDQMKNQLPEGKTIDDYEVNSDGYVIPKGTEGTRNEIPIIVDSNNDGIEDKIAIGDGNPNFNLSLNNSISYKNINLGFLFSWKNGGDIYNFTRQYAYRDLAAIEIDQFGKPEDQKKSIDYYGTLYKGTGINSHFVEDGSYLKLRELSLAYTLQGLGKIAKSVRFGIQVRNAYTWTNYTGYDPEVASGSDAYPFDNFGYPNFRTYSGSIKIVF